MANGLETVQQLGQMRLGVMIDALTHKWLIEEHWVPAQPFDMPQELHRI